MRSLIRRPLVSFAVAMVSLLAWVGALTANILHEAAVLHVECAEHGETVEVTAELADELANAPAASADDPESHDHDCDLSGVIAHGTAAAHTPTPQLPVPVLSASERLHLYGQAQRGPPLAYAPKTSPPVLG